MDKKEIINFLKNKKTYKQVLGLIEDLSQKNGVSLKDYPQEYFLAGGAVANTIYYLLNKDKIDGPIINDIDLFFFNHVNERSWGYNNTENFIQEYINQVTTIDSYGRVWLGSYGEEIRMVSSERFGIVNKITINVNLLQKEFILSDYYEQLLKNFDLNCCSVGLDMVNQKIIFNDKFVEFLVTNQIEVTSLAQPLQTSVRMLKKSKELKTDISNFEKEMLLLQHSFLITPSRFIGPEWMVKADNYSFFLGDYFMQDPYTKMVDNLTLYNYTSKDFTLMPYMGQFKFKNEKSLLVFWDIFVRMKSPEKFNKILSFYIIKKGLRNGDKTEMWSRTSLKIKTKLVNESDFDFIDCLQISEKYFDCDFSLDDLITIDNFFKLLNNHQNHFSNAQPFIVDKLNNQIKMIDYFNKNFIDKNGEIKTKVLYKIFSKSSYNKKDILGISSLDVDEKINFFDRLVNNIWIREKNSNLFKHNFKYRMKIPNAIEF